MRLLKAFVVFGLTTQAVSAQGTEGVIVRCGASSGHAFFFKDKTMNPDGPNWDRDGMSTGKIVLVRHGKEWDILFDDSLRASGYRQDGANVVPLMEKPGILAVGAFHPNYVDIYTFDMENKVVAWSSNKIGPFAPKVAAYVATCQ